MDEKRIAHIAKTLDITIEEADQIKKEQESAIEGAAQNEQPGQQ